MTVRLIGGDQSADLRRRVLRPWLPPGAAMGGYPDGALHVGVFDESWLVGTCVVFPAPFGRRPDARAWQLRAMAVEPDRQGTGVGSRVLEAALAEVAGGGGELLWCDARLTAARFYARHGLVQDGEPFVQADTGLPHVRMWLRLDEQEQRATHHGEPFDPITSSI